MSPKRLFILDAMNLAFRFYFALGRAQLSTKEGLPISSVLGTANFLNKLCREENPDYLIAAFDTKEPTFRQQEFADYKANREQMDDELSVQLPYFYNLLEAYACPHIAVHGFEADDIVASLVKKFSSAQLEIYIVSGDKDFFQLIDNKTFVYSSTKDKGVRIIGEKEVEEKYQCLPKEITNAFALIGDAVDNVPGVPGIGIVNAGKLIKEFRSLENIYKNIDKITARKQQENLIRYKKQAFLSRKLVTLNADLPINIKLEDCLYKKPDKNNIDLINLYKSLGFNSLLADLENKTVNKTVVEKSQKTVKIISQKTWEVLKIECLKCKDLFFVVNYKKDFDCLTSIDESINFYINKKNFELNFSSPYWLNLTSASRKKLIRFIFSCNYKNKVTYDLKGALHFLKKFDVKANEKFHCLKIADYVLKPTQASVSLESCQASWLEKNSFSSSVSSLDDLYLKLIKELKLRSLFKVYQDIDLPLTFILFELEQTGIYFDKEKIFLLEKNLDKKISDLTKKIYKYAGEKFNINSPKQLQVILFDKLKIHEKLKVKSLKKTKTGFSTDESVLLKLSEEVLPKLLLEYREINKIQSTYVTSLPIYVNKKTKRIHTNLNQTVTATGRLSSDQPNLQNIPSRSFYGQEIRKCFKAQKPGWFIISADYSQIEIRILAHMSKEKALINALLSGEDIHTLTAANTFEVPLDKVTSKMRAQAKSINFGIIYGMGPQRLAQETGMTLFEARTFIERYFQAYPKIKTFTEKLIDKAVEKKYCTTLFGRQRPLEDPSGSKVTAQRRLENIAVNSPIQGTAADIIKLAMINLSKELKSKSLETKIVLQIHDELLLESPKSELEKAMLLVKSSMQHAAKLAVPLEVAVSNGKNWFQAHKI